MQRPGDLQARPRRTDQRGVVAILASLSSLVFFGFSAMVVDLAVARDMERQAQTASDASALAAGNTLYLAGETPDIAAATEAAKTYAANNYGVTAAEWAACTDPAHLVVPAGGTPCISFGPNLTQPTTVRVKVPWREVATPFAAMLGVRHVTVAAEAHATIDPGGSARCGLCVIGIGVTHDLQNGDATIHGAGIHFNGSVSVSSNGLVATDGDITVEGSALGSLNNYTPDPLTGQLRIPDPLRGLALPPDLTGMLAKTDPCGTGSNNGPGIYGARNLRGVTCTLQPGLYVIAGDASTVWDLAGNASTRLEGTGVTLYFTCGTTSAPRTCNPGEAGATMDASGNGLLSVKAPSSGPLQGLVIVYDRQNTSTMRLTGSGSDNLTGTMYLSSGTVLMNGNGCSSPYNSLIVVKELAMDGNGACLQSAYTREQNVQIPASGLHLSR